MKVLVIPRNTQKGRLDPHEQEQNNGNVTIGNTVNADRDPKNVRAVIKINVRND